MGWPKTSGSRGMHIVVRLEPRWTFEKCAAARSRSRAKSRRALRTSPPASGGKKSVMACSSTTIRMPRIARSHPPIGAADARCARLDAAHWNEVDDCDPADFTLATVPARIKKLGDVHAAIDGQAGSIAGLLDLFERQGMGDSPWPPHYKRQASEPPRVQPSKRKKAPGDRDWPGSPQSDALAGLERWRAAPPAGGGRTAAGRYPGGHHARTLQHLDAHTRQSAACARGPCDPLRRRSIRTRRSSPARRAARLRAGRAAVLRPLVGPPAQKNRRMAETIALHVVVLHLTDALDPERLPRQVLARAPATLRAGHAA